MRCLQVKQKSHRAKGTCPWVGKWILLRQERIYWVKDEFLDPVWAKKRALPDLGAISLPRSFPKLSVTGRYEALEMLCHCHLSSLTVEESTTFPGGGAEAGKKNCFGWG